MKKSLRFDHSRLDDIRRDQNGYLVAKAALTRTGVFVYRHPDGSTTRELRHPDDVFKKASLDSLQNRPITFGHPAVGRLTPKNTRYFAVGNAIGEVKHDEKFVSADLQVTDEDTIDSIMDEDSPVREISCGYDVKVVNEDGEYNGEKYDHRQTEIIYNHIAIVKRGRAGREVRLQLDAEDATMVHEDDYQISASETEDSIVVRIGADQYESASTSTREVPGVEGVQMVYSCSRDEATIRSFTFTKSAGWTMDKAKEYAQNHRNDSVDTNEHEDDAMSEKTKIKIRRDAIATKTFKADGFEVVVDGTAEAAEKAVDTMQARIDALVAHVIKLEGDKDTLQGRLDAMGAQGEISSKRVFQLAKERADIEGVASYVGLKNFGHLENFPLKKAVVMKCSKADSLDPSNMSEEYISGRYDAIVDNIRREKKGLDSLAALAGTMTEDPALLGLTAHGDEESPRDKLMKDTSNMWRDPAPGAKH